MTRNDPWYGSNPPAEGPEAVAKRRRGRLFGWAILLLFLLIVIGVWLLVTQVMMPFFNEQLSKLEGATDVFDEVMVTTSDMTPALLPGDRVLTVRLQQPGVSGVEINRGDVVLIGEGPDQRFLRVVALAGDTVIQLASGEVEVVPAGRAGESHTYCAGIERSFEGRKQYVILEPDYYLLGDNCLEASDSRDFALGPVGFESIAAVAIWRQVPDGLPQVLKDMGSEKSGKSDL